jgi:hypothetical protein
MNMAPAVMIFAAMIAVFLVGSFLLGWRPRRDRQLAGDLRQTPDYAAMSEIESHDIDDMLDGINERRRRTGRRDLGEELADELLRGTWDGD